MPRVFVQHIFWLCKWWWQHCWRDGFRWRLCGNGRNWLPVCRRR